MAIPSPWGQVTMQGYASILPRKRDDDFVFTMPENDVPLEVAAKFDEYAEFVQRTQSDAAVCPHVKISCELVHESLFGEAESRPNRKLDFNLYFCKDLAAADAVLMKSSFHNSKTRTNTPRFILVDSSEVKDGNTSANNFCCSLGLDKGNLKTGLLEPAIVKMRGFSLGLDTSVDIPDSALTLVARFVEVCKQKFSESNPDYKIPPFHVID